MRQHTASFRKNGIDATITCVVSYPDGYVSYVASIYKSNLHNLGLTTYAIKSFGSEASARRWVNRVLDRPEFMLLRFNGKVIYDIS